MAKNSNYLIRKENGSSWAVICLLAFMTLSPGNLMRTIVGSVNGHENSSSQQHLMLQGEALRVISLPGSANVSDYTLKRLALGKNDSVQQD